jgi:hypothetical protein
MSSPLATCDSTVPVAVATDFNFTPLVGVEMTLPPLSGGPMTDQLPISENSTTFGGERGRLYADDFLYRIYVTPLSFTLGNIAGTTTRSFSIWNATAFDTTLLSIAATNADGIAFSGQPAPPLLYGPLQDRSYTITITPEGPAAIAASWSFTFSNGDTRVMTMTGNRAVAWTWPPDWSQPLVERLEWRTEVHRSFNGREQRRRLRQGARRTVELPTFMSDADRQRLELAVFGWGARSWALPLWWDGQALAGAVAPGALTIACSTTHREFAVGRYGVLLTGYDVNEIVEVASVTSSAVTLARPVAGTWPAGTMFYPATIAQLDPSITVERFTDAASFLRASFTSLEPADVTAGALPLYLGYPVLDSRPLLPGSMSATYERKLEDFDSETGARFRDDESGIPALTQTFGWLATTRAEKAAVRALLYLLAGRAGAVWLPTMAADFTLVATVADNTSLLDVRNCRYTLFGQTAPGRNHLRIERQNGTVTYHKITGSAEVNAAVERVTVTPAITPALAPADVAQMSFLQLHRQSGDAVELGHFTGESFDVRSSFTGFRHDL